MTEQEREVYEKALRRCRDYVETLSAEERESGEFYTAFEITVMLGIAFGMNPEEVMRDYLNQ